MSSSSSAKMPAEILGRKVGSVGYGLLGCQRPHTFTQLNHSNSSSQDTFTQLNHSNSLTLLNKYYAKYPEDADKVVLNSKGALKSGLIPDGSPKIIVRQSVERCVEMLGGKGKIDMLECGRRDPNTEVDIKSPGNAKKRVHGRAEPYFSQKLSLLCIFACALHTNLLTVRMHTFVAI